MEKIRTTVKIAGKEYTMTGYDSEEYVRRVARYVDRTMTELSLATRLPTNSLAVLTALNIADDMLKAHDEITRTRKELDQTREQLESLRAELTALRKKTGETV